ncbi:hypothetical protein [Spartinivicinus ruber]|nr:hypothetical protein [Spartinivicinus ruber]
MTSTVAVAGMTMMISFGTILIAGLAVGIIVSIVENRVKRPDY